MTFEELYLKYRRGVFAHCRRYLFCEDDARDAASETWLKALRNWHLFNGKHPWGWLKTIATNTCIDVLRLKSRQKAAEIPPVAVDDVWETVRVREEHRAVQRALKNLRPSFQRELLHPSTTYSTGTKARAALRARLGEEW